MKKAFSVFLGIVLCMTVVFSTVGLTACDDGIIQIGFTYYAPINYKDEEGNFVGHDTELAKRVFEELGYEYEFVEIDWDAKIIELNSRRIDVIWNGMTITDELKAAINISDPYMVNQQVIVVKSENANKYNTAADLLNASSIVYESGSAAKSALEGIAGIDKVKTAEAESQAKALMEVAAGTSEVGVIDITMAMSMTGAGTDYEYIVYKNVGFEEEQYGVGVRKGEDDFLKEINDKLAELKEEGYLDELYDKYMGGAAE